MARMAAMKPAAFFGFDELATAIVLVDADLVIRYLNPAAENLFELSGHSAVSAGLRQIFRPSAALDAAIEYARSDHGSYIEHDLEFGALQRPELRLSCTVTPLEVDGHGAREGLLLEFRPLDQQLRIAEEERVLGQNEASSELLRNLAHEVKNPLGGIRGAAQLLERELDAPALREYTQVIIHEADRLQSLMDRLLMPHRLPQPAPLNIHEALERVRSLIQAEYPGINVERDYDASLPPLTGDREQIIQALLNIARNAAQALAGSGEIRLRTRIARQVTLARRRYRHAIRTDIIDDGPGIAPALRDRIFFPLVSGREGGSGLGLMLAQNFVTRHGGTISFQSVPGNTCFTVLLPIEGKDEG
jgi:two-component system nitrogen regulation sensor histidine kinase GlnL